MATPPVWPHGALDRLRLADPALGLLIDQIGPCTLVPGQGEGPLAALTRAVVYQQLSGKAAATIHGRFRALFAPDRFPTARQILAVDDERLRACGLSRQKISYLRSLGEHVAQGTLELDRLGELSDDEIIAQLRQVKGFGRWTAQMFLIFQLGRPDVWPHDDLGVRKALARLQGRDELPSLAEAQRDGDRYRPYRTLAAWYLWRSLAPLTDETAASL